MVKKTLLDKLFNKRLANVLPILHADELGSELQSVSLFLRESDI